MRLRMRTWISALSLFAVSCAVELWVLHQTHRWPRGNAPHSAIMASSLVNRGSFDVKPSYLSGDYIGVFYYEQLDSTSTRYVSRRIVQPGAPTTVSEYLCSWRRFCLRGSTSILPRFMPYNSARCFFKHSEW